MTNKVILIVFSFFSHFGMAQDIKGYVLYQQHEKFGNSEGASENLKDSNIDTELLKQIQEQFQKGFNSVFELYFYKHQSKYQKQESLEPVKPNSGFSMTVTKDGDDHVLFKDIKKNETIEVTDFYSRTFYIKDSLTIQKWEITQETKQIGDYLCIKAMQIIPVSKEALEAYEKEMEKSNAKKTNFLTPLQPKEKRIEAWFTPQIPIGHGPSRYHGLPGLILELKVDKEVFLATKIVLQSKDLKPIEFPKVKKALTQKEFAEMKKKKYESLQNEDGFIIIEQRN
ncbi:MAG: GLPGLI family protein [Flavobacteriales bacterium]|nr:GLPGLI family protein [Flavobacteriales bacterium]